MARERVQMKMKRKRIDSTKNAREHCNFCEFSSSSSEENLQQQDNESVMQKAVERLRHLIKRMTGKDDGVSFTELVALRNHLLDVQRIVIDQEKKIRLEEDERLCKRKKEAEDEDDGTRRRVLVPSTSSAEERQLRVEREFERRKAESLQSEFDRLWLLNERMNGRELEGMTSGDLILLISQVSGAVVGLNDHMSGPRMEEKARQGKEVVVCHSNKKESSVSRLNNDKDDDDTSLQFRLLSVSRKFRRFQNRYHRKSTPEIRSICQT